MDFKEIQELIRLINKSDLSEFRLEQEGVKLTLKKGGAPRVEGPSVPYIPPVLAQPIIAPPVIAANEPQPAATKAEPAPAKQVETDSANLVTIKSPMIGTFYRSSGPDKEPFVKVGDDINTGKVLCIIEAMKLFNEIEAELSGKLVKVLVDDATPVEYDQPLFVIDTSNN